MNDPLVNILSFKFSRFLKGLIRGMIFETVVDISNLDYFLRWVVIYKRSCFISNELCLGIN